MVQCNIKLQYIQEFSKPLSGSKFLRHTSTKYEAGKVIFTLDETQVDCLSSEGIRSVEMEEVYEKE